MSPFKPKIPEWLRLLLQRAGYDLTHAEQLHDEGMGPFELEERLKVPPGADCSLTYTHDFVHTGKPNRADFTKP